MKEIWRKTASLFWAYPMLWIPTFAADFIGFWLIRLEGWISNGIVAWVMQMHHPSVLSAAPDLADIRRSILIVSFLTAPFAWSLAVTRIFLYTMSLLATAQLVLQAIRAEKVFFSELQSCKFLSLRYAMTFSLKLFFVYGIMTWLGIRVFSSTLTSPFGLTVMPWILALIVSIVAAYFMVPACLRLLRDEESALTGEQLIIGRISTFLCLLISLQIALFVTQAERSIEGPHFYGVQRLLFEIVGSLLTAFPYVPLFIALTLLAHQAKTENEAA